MTRIAAVTGGSGTVGLATVNELLTGGWEVRALARSPQAADSLPGSVTVVPGDVRSAGDVARLVNDADTVFHIAGVNSMCVADQEQMWAINVEAPVTVYRSAVAAGVRKVVHVSSAAAVGHRTSFYADTKWEADRALVAEAAENSVPISLIAPSSVQGPGRVSGTGKLILDVIDGRIKYLIDTTISIVDIADCARAIRLAADVDSGTDRLLISGFTISTRRAVELLEEVTGRSVPVRFLPPTAIRPLAWFGPLLGPIGRLVGVELCREMIRTMATDHVHDGAPAAALLGLTYRSAADTFSRLVRWAESNGHT